MNFVYLENEIFFFLQDASILSKTQVLKRISGNNAEDQVCLCLAPFRRLVSVGMDTGIPTCSPMIPQLEVVPRTIGLCFVLIVPTVPCGGKNEKSQGNRNMNVYRHATSNQIKTYPQFHRFRIKKTIEIYILLWTFELVKFLE